MSPGCDMVAVVVGGGECRNVVWEVTFYDRVTTKFAKGIPWDCEGLVTIGGRNGMENVRMEGRQGEV